MNIPDNYDIWLAHEEQMERELEARPVCDHCENRIQEEFCYEVEGMTICPRCMDTYFRRELDI